MGSLAYEAAEADIMERPPRDAKEDHLVTLKLVSFAYLQIGVFQALGGFYSFFTVMYDYGFKSGDIFGDYGKSYNPLRSSSFLLIDSRRSFSIRAFSSSSFFILAASAKRSSSFLLIDSRRSFSTRAFSSSFIFILAASAKRSSSFLLIDSRRSFSIRAISSSSFFILAASAK